MEQQKYYIAVIEEYDRDNESPFRIERKGLFKSYLKASQWLVDEGMETYAEKCPFDDEYELYFELYNSLETENYIGYVEEIEVI